MISAKSLGLHMFLLALGVLVVLGLITSSVHAAPTGTTRYVATTGSDSGNNCATQGSPCSTIQNAVNNSTSGDTIKVAQGTYTYAGNDNCTFLQTRAVVCIVDKILTILGGYTTSNWSSANPYINVTAIDGLNAQRGVAVIKSLATTSLDMEGFTIQNGVAHGPTYVGVPDGMGGGMWVQVATVTLRDMILRSNQAIGADMTSGSGGAATGAGLRIESSPSGSSSLLQRVTFDNNQSTGGNGPDRGGLAYGAMFVYASAVTVQDSTFTNNRAIAHSSSGSGIGGDGNRADALGGALALEAGTSVTLTHLTLTNNSTTGGNATKAGGAFGGAIYADNGTSFSLSDSTVNNNLAQAGNGDFGGYGAGGGILVLRTPATIDRTTVRSNTAQGGNSSVGNNAGTGAGGGVYLWDTRSSPASATLTNLIIADNFMDRGTGINIGGGGGGIVIQGLPATLTHITFARNRLGSTLVAGQAILVVYAPGGAPATANVNYNIIANHTQDSSGAYAVYVVCDNGSALTFNQGLFAGNTSGKDTGASCSPAPINGLPIDSASSAGFVSPGAPNYNYHIQATSAAKDQAIGSATPIDIDGQTRPYGSASDVGADEVYPLNFHLYLPLIIK